MPEFEYLFTLSADVGELVTLGHGPLGERRVVYITSGTFEGSGLRGEIVGGADWQINRADGALDIDARYAIREQGGAVIEVHSAGLRFGPPEVMARLARGEDVDPADYYFRTIMRFQTGDQKLGWLNRTIAVGVAERKARQVNVTCWKLL
jgi:hypothetical protein